MKFYRIDPQSGNRVKVYPETLITIEVVTQAKHLVRLTEILREVETLISGEELELVDHTTRRYFNDLGETIVYTKKEFSSRE